MRTGLLALSAVLGVGATVAILQQSSPKAKLNMAGKDYLQVREYEGEIDPARDSKADLKDPISVARHIKYLEEMEAKDPLAVKRDPKRASDPTAPESRADWYEAYLNFIKDRLNSEGKFDPSYIRRATEHRDQMQVSKWLDESGNQKPGGVWTNLGPYKTGDLSYSIYFGKGPVSGRKNDIAIYPGNPNIMFVASAGGGIWKTTNGGTNWTPLSDKWPYLFTSSVAVHPTNSNLILAGTGDSEGFFQHFGNGIMRSTDGGVNWTAVGPVSMQYSSINKIIFDPTNPNIVIAIGSDGYANEDSVYRSTDSGATWSIVTSGLSPNVIDWNDIDRSTGGTYYLVGTDNGTTKGYIYKSTNQGASWTAVTHPGAAVNKALDIACSKANANNVYLLDTGGETIWKSTTGGTSWSQIKGNFRNGATGSGANYNWSQKDYDYHITVSKNGTADVVYVGLIGINMDVNGDSTWTDISQTYNDTPPNYVHSDQHCAIVHPTDPSIVYFGLDGGIFKWKLTNPSTGAGTWTSLNATIADTQPYHMSVHPTDPNYVMAGNQDNATSASRGNYAAWSALYAGDGCWSAFDRSNPNIHYTGSQNGNVFRYTFATSTSPTTISPGIQNEFGFVAPMILVGSAGNEPVIGGFSLWKWVSGTNWNQTAMPTGNQQPASTLAVARPNGNVIYSGNPEGIIVMTTAKGANWAQIDNANIDKPIGAIGVAWANSYDVVVGMKGQGGSHVWRCSNTLAAVPVWTNVSGSGPTGLPDVPVTAIARDPYEVGRWYVGTDVGLFMTTNYGASYTNLTALGLPNVGVSHLVVDNAGAYLYAATFGRGIWRIPLVTAATKYSITGNIKEGASNLAGITTNLQVYRESSATYTANPNASIPDNNSTGIVLPITVAASAKMTKTAIYVNITHPYRGDLQIDIESPDGQLARLWNTAVDPTDNLIGTFTIRDFVGRASNGVWKLRVKDLGAGDVGTVVQWKVIPYYMANGTVTTTTTNASGNYTFSNLEAGQYKVFPTQTGKTFTPSSILVNVGPNATGKNFTRNP